MEISNLIFRVALLFIMMVPGVILKKCKMCPDGFGKGLSNLVLYIAQPAMILYAYISCEAKFADIWLNVLLVFIFSLFVHFLFSAVALLLFRSAEDGKRRMLRFVTIFSNAAFMGIPLIESIFGAEAAIYASIYNISFNLFLWTLGVHLCTRKTGEDMDGDGDSDLRDEALSAIHYTKKETSLLKVLLHPVTIASAVGIVLLICNVDVGLMEKWGLSIVTETTLMLKNLVAPLSMIVIGLRLADIKLTGIFKDRHMYLFLFLRHLALPLAVLGIIKLVQLCGIPVSDVVLLVTTILAATPAASSATMFAERYNCDAVYVSRLVVISTVISIATMPLVIILAQL